MSEFVKHFDHRLREPALYARWEASGAMRANAESSREAFVISMPPPNATGTLHLGHAVMLAIEDLMIRWKRMTGFEALWVPGTDHAAIATESAVIRQLRKKGTRDPRRELGREGLVTAIHEYVESSRSTIRSQIRAMGSSCDWSRERYTMDAPLNRCVNEVFGAMYSDGLIYRGVRIVNWDVPLQTTVSDDETYHDKRQATLYVLRYGPFEVATSRPETKLGDTALAVHPDDERYREWIGRTINVPWPKGPTISVRVVADQAVDPEFGTGMVGVTPAHSMIDAQIAERHDLPMIQVIGEDGRMTANAGPYAGLKIEACRETFVADLSAAGLLVSSTKYEQNVALCYRSGEPIEQLPKEQWFIDVNHAAVAWKGGKRSLRETMDDVVRSGDIDIVPAHEKKTYFYWVENLRDWCISRQIWWGHRVPVWYRPGKELWVGHGQPPGEGWEQDPDTLDTWFSSALWTWSTLVDPRLTSDPRTSLRQILYGSADYRRFHPTSVMETGYDILFFWVARMILMTTYVTGTVPFRTIYLHGLVLDKDGDKMSKSKPETCIDPLDAIRDSGADALRFALVAGTAAGSDTRMSVDKITGASRFINKLWNASKLVAMTPPNQTSSDEVRHPINRWILARVAATVQRTDAALQRYAFGEAADFLRNAFWSDFCDFYLEAAKAQGMAELPETTSIRRAALESYLRLLHPFTPFVTEEIWQLLGNTTLLMSETWPPAVDLGPVDGVDAVMRLITAIRNFRLRNGVAPKSPVDIVLRPLDHQEVFDDCRPVLQRMANVNLVDSHHLKGETLTDDVFEVVVSTASS